MIHCSADTFLCCLVKEDSLLSQRRGNGLEAADDQLCFYMEGNELEITCCQGKAEATAEVRVLCLGKVLGWNTKMCVKRGI